MNKSYRNTVEIASYANELVGITDMELFERHGEPVEEMLFHDEKGNSLENALDEIIKKLQLGEEQFETAAVSFEQKVKRKWQPVF